MEYTGPAERCKVSDNKATSRTFTPRPLARKAFHQLLLKSNDVSSVATINLSFRNTPETGAEGFGNSKAGEN